MSLTTIIQHGKAIIITFNETRNNSSYPAHNRNKRKDQYRNSIHCLPKTITQCKPDTTDHILQHLGKIKRSFLALNDRFCFFTQVCKYWRPDNEEQIFEKREIEKY